MKRLLLASLLTTLSYGIGSTGHAAPIAPRSAEPTVDRLAQIYLGDTPMATTYGRGMVTAPADTATLNYSFSRYDYSYSYSESGSSEEVSSFDRGDRDRLFAFFTSQGIPRDQISIDLNPYDIYVTLEIRDPTQAMLLELEDATYQFAEANSSFYFTNNYSTCGIEAPVAIEAEARLEAIADSRARIEAMAEAIGAQVGSILSMIELHGYMPISSSCDAPDGGGGAPDVTIELGVMTTFELID